MKAEHEGVSGDPIDEEADRLEDEAFGTLLDPLYETIYHYTDVSALVGILESRRLWATHAAFTNDRSEQKHALVSIRSAIDGALPELKFPYLTKILQSCIEDAAVDRYYHTFMVCFSGKKDDLSQWRGYADAGLGFAI